jgi:hypothetical protein
MPIEFAIAYASTGSVLIPLMLSWLQLRRIYGVSAWLTTLLHISLAADLAAFGLSRSSTNTYPIVNGYLFAQFITLTLIYNKELPKYRLLIYSAALFLLFFLINLLFLQGPFVFNTHSNSIGSILFSLIILCHFYVLFRDLPYTHIYQIPVVWISFAFLFYLSGTLILFLSNNLLVEHYSSAHRIVWIIHNLCNIIKNLLLGLALWFNYQNLKFSS